MQTSWLSYIPVSGKFYRDLDKLITAALPSDNLMVMGDLNACVGRSAKMWKKMIEPQISLFLSGEQAKQKLESSHKQQLQSWKLGEKYHGYATSQK